MRRTQPARPDELPCDDVHGPDEIPTPLPVIDLSGHGMVACVAMANLQQVEHARARAADHPGPRRPPAAPGDPHCMFCRTQNPSGSEEHILSRALGNHFWVLLPGVVCSKCNNEVLSRLDTALGKHPFIALQRVMARISGRNGQPPSVGASNVNMRRDESGALRVITHHKRHARQDGDLLQVELNWLNFGPKHHRAASLALLKFGTGLLWLGRGRAETDLAKYDHVRDAILGDRTVPIRQGFGNSKVPNYGLQGMAITADEARGLHVSLDYFGVHLWAETDGYAGEAGEVFLARNLISVDTDGDQAAG